MPLSTPIQACIARRGTSRPKAGGERVLGAPPGQKDHPGVPALLERFDFPATLRKA
ncbi:hypothetical protein GCM10010430_78450 [Kitasatospora cystarginea]|uniref:Uncharacterized protein n=1 Tax=Kitasatospora cystarginea TaxID=58350 RepID=A0ABP5RXY7_9ACTN